MNIKVDDQGAEREPEPITADVTGSMQRGLSYDPADMLGERVSVEHVGLPSPDAHAIAAERESPLAQRERAAWTRDIARMLREQTEVAPELRPGIVYAANWLDPARCGPVLTAEEMAIRRRPPLDRVAISNPDDVAQPGALTRVEILVGQLKFLDAHGLAALADAIRQRQGEVTA